MKSESKIRVATTTTTMKKKTLKKKLKRLNLVKTVRARCEEWTEEKEQEKRLEQEL